MALFPKILKSFRIIKWCWSTFTFKLMREHYFSLQDETGICFANPTIKRWKMSNSEKWHKQTTSPAMFSVLFIFSTTRDEAYLIFLYCIKLLVCLFEVFRPTQGFFTHMEASITKEGLQILTHTRQSWPFRNEDSLACHAYCDRGAVTMSVAAWIWSQPRRSVC